ncbi:MAG: dual specificity protein phosphatase family protein [Armatimonadota bacterium]
MSTDSTWQDEITWVLDGELAAFSAYALRDLERVLDAGIAAIVSLTEDFPPELVGERGLTVLHLPVADMTPPETEQIRRFVRFVDRMTSSGQAVGVHCLAGLGRTGTMIACYLVTRGMTAAAAIEYIRTRRPGSIQTEMQELAVRRWQRIHSQGTGLARFL